MKIKELEIKIIRRFIYYWLAPIENEEQNILEFCEYLPQRLRHLWCDFDNWMYEEYEAYLENERWNDHEFRELRFKRNIKTMEQFSDYMEKLYLHKDFENTFLAEARTIVDESIMYLLELIWKNRDWEIF